MTLLVAWISIDNHGPSAIHIAADSRVSWGSRAKYDRGRKVFSCKYSADIFGYCGDVLFPSLALARAIETADAGLLFSPSDSPSRRSELMMERLAYELAAYPHHVRDIMEDSVEIIHAARSEDSSQFECYVLRWTRGKGWTRESKPLPSRSDVLFQLGSGAKDFSARYESYEKGPTANTSRGVFHCFCDSLNNSGIPTVGGAPQLVGLIRKRASHGIAFGIISDRRKTYLGADVGAHSFFERTDWKNELFEICDGKTGNRKRNAQPQPNPHAKRL